MAPLALVVALGLGLGLAALNQSLLTQETEHLAAIAQVKKDQIERWLAERLADAALAAERSELLGLLRRSGHLSHRPQGELDEIRSAERYVGAAVFDPALAPILASGEPIAVGETLRAAAAQALGQERPVLERLPISLHHFFPLPRSRGRDLWGA